MPAHRRGIETIIVEVVLIAVTMIAAALVAGFTYGLMDSSSKPAEVEESQVELSADMTRGPLNATCSSRDAENFVMLTNTGESPASVVSVSLTFEGSTSTEAVRSGACEIQAGGWLYLNFVSIGPQNFSQDQSFAGLVGLSNGAEVPFAGTFG